MDFERIDFDCGTAFVIAGAVELGQFDRFLFDARKSVTAAKPWLLLDMAQVEFIDSSGITIIIELFKSTKKAGGELVIAGLKDYPAEVFRNVRLDRFIRTFPDRPSAMAGMNRNAGASGS